MKNPVVIKLEEDREEEVFEGSLAECDEWIENNEILFPIDVSFYVHCQSPYFRNGQWLH